MTALVRVAALLPKGTPIGDELFTARHRAVLAVLWAHAVGLLIFGAVRNAPPLHLAAEIGAIVAITVAARAAPGRSGKAAAATLGLVSCSALLVHLSGGLIESHFHFFIVVTLVTIYQSWVPFSLAMLFVVIHHGSVGVLDPSSVYNHPAATQRPWLWAAIHGLFVTGAATAALVAWKHVEVERERAEDAAIRLHDRAARHREAMELNDTVVQGLVAAKYEAQLGRPDAAAQTVDRTLERAQQLVAALMDEDRDPAGPGALRRVAAAQVEALP